MEVVVMLVMMEMRMMMVIMAEMVVTYDVKWKC